MSSQTEADDNGDREFKKTVNIVAYDADEDYPSIHEWAAELTGQPTNETYEDSMSEWYVIVDLGGTEIRKRIRSSNLPEVDFSEIEDYDDWKEQKKNEIRDKFNSLDSDMVRVEKETDTVTKRECSLPTSGRRFIGDLKEELPGELEGGLEWNNFHSSWQQKDGDASVRLNSQGFDEKRILAKEAERESDDLYETLSKFPAYTLQVEMVTEEEERLDEWTNTVVTGIHKALANNPAVGKVRYMACEVQETRKGECYNL